ncbi:hypothetical protein DZC78_13545 [Olleya aquimaris]|uniref:Uncharacterized protein n=1 Tax=Olleya sediminilitoris TaxID=2795739 RepID=A0ABS1WJP7_9FLAO|nr:hypothetical protein [Olleya sediminilitoris]AXO81369.1 hypothetical protein DZC78_13545 [Olleya aquimaris]MBL7559298.1 hypothetical protein [Olleya sediminilitoris]
MKNKVYFISITLLTLALFNCSKTEISEDKKNFQETKIINNSDTETSARYVCIGGFGIFSNLDYDCGYKKGIEKYIEDYNKVIEDYEYPECQTLSLTFKHNAHPSDEDMNDPTFTIIDHLSIESQTFNNSGIILQTMATVYNDFRQWCNPSSSDNDNTKGYKAGYLAFWGQQPLSDNPTDDCNDGEISPLSFM